MKSLKYFLLLFIPSICLSQSEIPDFITDSLDTYIERGLKNWKIPGCAVAIIKNGKIVVSKGYGFRDMDATDPVNEHTLFMIASNTKAVTGISLAKLELEKKLHLDDKVIKWLHWFKLYESNSTQIASIKDMVTHRIGFETFQGDFCHWSTSTSRRQVIEKMSKIKPVYDFRDKWGYCNAGYVVAGEIIELATGKKWEEYIKESFFLPLGMNETLSLSADFTNAKNRCTPHTIYDEKLIKMNVPNIDNLAPAASICSSVADWSKWVVMLLNKGIYENREIVSEKAIAKSMEPVSVRGAFNPLYNSGHFGLYGLGWVLNEYAGKKLVSHTGGADGFVSSVTLLPEEQLGIIVFTNSDANGFYQALKWEILDAYLHLEYRNYSDVSLQRYLKSKEKTISWLQSVRDSVKMNFSPSIPLKSYAGKYENEVYGMMELQVDGNRLIAKFEHHPNQHAILEHIGSDRFLCSYSNPLLGIKVFPFEVKHKKVKSVMVSCDDFVEFTNYKFNRK
jgi:CubicO group peptidase (beta-lactamase class C family)